MTINLSNHEVDEFIERLEARIEYYKQCAIACFGNRSQEFYNKQYATEEILGELRGMIQNIKDSNPKELP